MNKKERFNKLVRYLVYAFDLPYNGVLRAIGEKVGISSSNLSTALNGNERFLTDSIIKKVNTAFGSPFHIEWLIYGVGEMLNDNAAPVIKDTEWVVQSQQETIASLTASLDALSSLLRQKV